MAWLLPLLSLMSDDEDFEMPEDDMPVTQAIISVRPSALPSVIITESAEQPSNVSPEEVKSALEDLEPAKVPETAPPPESESMPVPEAVFSPQKSARTSFSPVKGKALLPLMNPVTVDRNTYDLDRLLSPHVQKKAETLDRFSAAHLEGGNSLPRDSTATDFVKRNRESAGRLSQEKPEARRRSTDDSYGVDERFYSYQRGVEAKVRKLEEEKLRKEKASCTFTPAILAQPKANPRSADLFYEEMMRHEQRVQAKVQALRTQTSQAQQSLQDSFFRPHLCEKSLEMVKKDPKVPAHEKLYQTHKQRMQKHIKSDSAVDLSVSLDSQATQDSTKPFTPAINKKSLSLVRDQPFEVYLSEDAKRRAKRLSQAPASSVQQPAPSPNSVLLLVKRFREEFAQAWTALDEDSTGALTYSKTADLLKQLHFIANQSGAKEYEAERALVRSLWTTLRLTDEDSAQKDNLETLLLAIMNFPVKETPPIPTENEGKSSDQAFEPALAAFGRIEGGVLLLSPGDTLRIHLHFKGLYDHRANTVQRSNKNPSFKVTTEHPYRPQISKASQKLTEDRKEQLAAQGFKTKEDFLVAEAMKRDQTQKEKKAKADKALMKECTFQPKVDKRAGKLIGTVTERVKDSVAKDYIGMLQHTLEAKTDILYQFATVASQRRNYLAKSAQEREMERNEVECTFAPDRSLTANYDEEQGDFMAAPAKGVEKAVERLARGRRQSVELAMIREKGMPFSSSWLALHSLHYDEAPEEPATVLAVQVNGRAAELRIRPGDKLDFLINVFLAQHRLTGPEAEDVRAQLNGQYEQISGSTF